MCRSRGFPLVAGAGDSLSRRLDPGTGGRKAWAVRKRGRPSMVLWCLLFPQAGLLVARGARWPASAASSTVSDRRSLLAGATSTGMGARPIEQGRQRLRRFPACTELPPGCPRCSSSGEREETRRRAAASVRDHCALRPDFGTGGNAMWALRVRLRDLPLRARSEGSRVLEGCLDHGHGVHGREPLAVCSLSVPGPYPWAHPSRDASDVDDLLVDVPQ